MYGLRLNHQTNHMQRGFRIIITYLSIAVLLVLLAFVLPDRTTESTSSQPSCVKTEGTCAEPGKAPADDLMLENLSRQFILVSPVN
jgi:hypothetical protein